MTNDLISRKAALLDYQSACFYVGCGECPFFIDKGCDWERWIENLPSAQPEPKKGEWVYIGGDEWCCSECGNVVSTEGAWDWPCFEKYKMFHCNICGADMRGGQDAE